MKQYRLKNKRFGTGFDGSHNFLLLVMKNSDFFLVLSWFENFIKYIGTWKIVIIVAT